MIEKDGDGRGHLLNAEELAQQLETERWDDKLRAVLDALEITPKQALPSWVLHAYLPG